ncbi:MAG: hypothetical protein IPM82_28495 [Saprospiraceae bacterium]|nr:hypothetical protein [Saprospiraceae bacterium]
MPALFNGVVIAIDFLAKLVDWAFWDKLQRASKSQKNRCMVRLTGY